ncbi:MAG: hypothetical protein ABL993_00870 [Vicinamibacterales bacterium]
MKHEITLTGFDLRADGTMQVDYLWNDSQLTQVYTNAQEMVDQNGDILQNPEDSLRWLLYYLLALGHTELTMQSAIGKKLTVDIGHAVQQTISLT